MKSYEYDYITDNLFQVAFRPFKGKRNRVSIIDRTKQFYERLQQHLQRKDINRAKAQNQERQWT